MGISHVVAAFIGGALVLGGVWAFQPREPIHWDDGDSGEIGLVRFRLMDVDAPERRSFKCEAENQFADEAWLWMQDFTAGKRIEIVETDGHDSWGRVLARVTANGEDVSEAGLAAGYLKPWPHDGTRALTDRPDWCAGLG